MINTEQVLCTELMYIHTNEYPNAEGVKETLTNIIRNQGDRQNHETNVKANMTTWDMYKNESFKLIIDFAIDTLKQEVQPYPTGETYCTDAWGIIYKTGDKTNPHAHWPSLWSFTYYVDACSECSPLMLLGAKGNIKPNTGLIFIFPATVSHYVPEQKCKHDRIVIAGNISIGLEEAKGGNFTLRRKAYEGAGWGTPFDLIEDIMDRGMTAVQTDRKVIKAAYPNQG